MNTRTNPKTHSGTARCFSWIIALALVFSLLAVPTRAVSADSNAVSAELVLSAEGMEASGKIALDPDQMLLAAAIHMTMGDMDLADAAAYLSGQAVAMDGSSIGGAYGLDLATLARNLPKSIFAPNSGSYYALDEEIYNQIILMLNGGLNPSVRNYNFKADSGSIPEAMNTLAEYYSGIAEELASCLSIETANASLVVNGKPMQVLQGRCSVDGEAVADILEVLIAPLQDNAEAQDALAALIDEFAAAAEEEMDITGEEMVQTIVSELPEMLPDLAQELEDEGFSASFIACLTPDEQAPVKYALELRDEGETVAINLLMSEAKDFFRFELVENGRVEAFAQLDVQENTDSALVCKLSVQSDGEEISLTFGLNKTGKAFSLSACADNETHSVSGFYSSSDTLFSITIDKIDGQDFGGTLTLNLRSDDTITMPAFTDLTELSEEELDTLVQTIEDSVEYLYDIFG